MIDRIGSNKLLAGCVYSLLLMCPFCVFTCKKSCHSHSYALLAASPVSSTKITDVATEPDSAGRRIEISLS